MIGIKIVNIISNKRVPPIMYSPSLYPKNVNPVNVLAKKKVKKIKILISNEKVYFCFVFNFKALSYCNHIYFFLKELRS